MAIRLNRMPPATSQSHILSAIPDFLAPCLAQRRIISRIQAATFSTSQTTPYPRDRNKTRGVSPIRRTGLREPLSVSKYPLPKPVLDPKKRTSVVVDENHGLWGFFNKEKTALATPEEDFAHGRSTLDMQGKQMLTDMFLGRPWTVEELRHKSWEDLHSLWWVCAKERNRIHTSSKERERLNAGYGQFEAENREKTVSNLPIFD